MSRPKNKAETPPVYRYTLGGDTHCLDDIMSFGEAVLEILDSHREWNADTLDEIASEAKHLGLADTDCHGHFRNLVLPEEHPNPNA